MTAQILQFPKPGDQPFTIGQCVAFADRLREDCILSNAWKMLQEAEERLADGQVGAANSAMIICARLLHREVFEVRLTPQDNQHVLFTLPAQEVGQHSAPAGATKLPRQQRRPSRRHPTLRLPFVVDRRKAGLPAGEGKRSGKRCFWHVSPSGDYSLDVETGRALAQQYLEFRDCEPPPFQWIVEDMPRDLTGIEIGFLSLIGRAASPRIARQIRDHESRVMAAFAEANGEPEAPGV